MSMKKITGFSTKKQQAAGGSVDTANELNAFFNRFSTTPPPPISSNTPLTPSPPQQFPHSFSHPLTPQPLSGDTHPPPPLEVSAHQVKKQLEKLKLGKAAGPDGIIPRVLKVCANQLCEILQQLFNLSLREKRVPVLWKTSCLVPVPKKSQTSSHNDYRPVALTLHVMKVLERLVLSHLRPQVSSFLDPLQFAYQQQVGVDDAVIYLLQKAHFHLDQSDTSVRITFFDFSSAFNTIQPVMLEEKMRKMRVDKSMISWVSDYLSGRPQYVKIGTCQSEHLISNIGAPQGTVLSPFLFTLYTTDFQYRSDHCHLQKFSDDSVVVGCIKGGQDGEYRDLVNSFVEWCTRNQLLLNVMKTKEMVVDFRRKTTTTSPVTIMGQNVELVDSYKYLGVLLDNKLDWKVNTEAVYKKGMSRLYFLRRLRSFNVCSKMLEIFYQSVVAGAIFFAAVCWGSSIRGGNTKKLNKLIKKASSVLGCSLDGFEVVVERRSLNKLTDILENTSHPLHDLLVRQRSTFSNRLIQLRCRKERYRRSFIPTAITLYNSSSLCRDLISH